MDAQQHTALVAAVNHGDPDDFTPIEVAFLMGIVESYAQNARKLIQKKRQVLGPKGVEDMKLRADAAARMNTKLAEMLAKKGGSHEHETDPF